MTRKEATRNFSIILQAESRRSTLAAFLSAQPAVTAATRRRVQADHDRLAKRIDTVVEVLIDAMVGEVSE